MGKYSGYCEERQRRGISGVRGLGSGIRPHSCPAQVGLQLRSHPLLAEETGIRRGSDGFSLVELAIVLVILSIVAVAGAPMLGSAVNEARLSGAADEVATALEYAQMIAMTSGMKTRVAVSPTFNTIYVRRYYPSADLFAGGNQLAEADVETETYSYMQYPLKRGSDYVIDLNVDERFQGVRIALSSFSTITPVYFNAIGSPSHGGTVTLALGNRQKVVTLNGLTGKVTVSD